VTVVSPLLFQGDISLSALRLAPTGVERFIPPWMISLKVIAFLLVGSFLFQSRASRHTPLRESAIYGGGTFLSL